MLDLAALKRLAELQVHAGINLLNEKKGRRWYKSVDINVIDQCSTTKDVLGQVYGSYERGMKKLGFYGTPLWLLKEPGLDPIERPLADKGAPYGFAIGKHYMPWPILSEVWRERIKALQG